MLRRWQFVQVSRPLLDLFKTKYEQYLSKLLLVRGIQDFEAAEKYLDARAYQPTLPEELPGLSVALERVVKAITSKDRITVYGDFDCDGVTSTAVLVSGLKALEADVNFVVPLRVTEGHGLNEKRVRELNEAKTQLIITCDCGVSDSKAIALASELGMDVIVTDHHLLPAEMPECVAVLNPLMLSVDHPLRYLTGVGVAYKLVEALWAHYSRAGVDTLLDLVAVGLIADVAVLQRENRYLVQRGLQQLESNARLGLQALLEQSSGSSDNTLSSRDIGFGIAPRLNAIGRLDDARFAVELLLCENPEEARAMIPRVEIFNSERKQLVEAALVQARQMLAERSEPPKAVVLHHSEWEPGIVGVAASSLVREYDCPVVLVAKNGSASGRSWGDVHITQAFETVREHLEGFGGHPKAGGFRVSPDRRDLVMAQLQRELERRMRDCTPQPTLEVSLYFDADTNNLQEKLNNVFKQMQRLEPFGEGNPAPVVAVCNLKVSRFNPSNPDLTLNGEHLVFSLSRRYSEPKLYWWREAAQQGQILNLGTVDIAFTMHQVDHNWRGHVVAVRRATRLTQAIKPKEMEVVDCREDATAVPDGVREILFDHPPEVWPSQSGEAVFLPQAPPSAQQLRLVLTRCKPSVLYLANKQPDWGQLSEWVQQFAQILDTGGREVEDFAATGLPMPVLWQWNVHEHRDIDPLKALVQILRESYAFSIWYSSVQTVDLEQLVYRQWGIAASA